MASVRKIAKLVGVSPATVSRAINNQARVAPDVRRKVLAAANRSRYIPKVSKRETMYVALAYTSQASLSSPFDAALLQGMSERMGELGFDLVIFELARTRLPNETYSQMFMRKGIRGVVLRTDAATRSVCLEIVKEGFPAVVLGDRFDEPGVSFIDSDSLAASRDAVEHLIALGHKKIAMSLNIIDDSDHADRLAGYREALAKHKIDVDENMILRIPANRDGGRQLMRRIKIMPDAPTALFVADPGAVVGVLAEARHLGIDVPRDLSIVGFDDWELRHSVTPELTAVCQDAVAIGREAFNALHGILEQPHGAPAVRRTMRTWLELHESTSAPSAPSAALSVAQARVAPTTQ